VVVIVDGPGAGSTGVAECTGVVDTEPAHLVVVDTGMVACAGAIHPGIAGFAGAGEAGPGYMRIQPRLRWMVVAQLRSPSDLQRNSRLCLAQLVEQLDDPVHAAVDNQKDNEIKLEHILGLYHVFVVLQYFCLYSRQMASLQVRSVTGCPYTFESSSRSQAPSNINKHNAAMIDFPDR
jgi:hypothetical protein